MGYAESAKKIPSIAWKAAKSDAQKRELEHVWAKDPYYAYRYAQDIIRKPWPPGEAAIAKDPKWAYGYAHFVIKKPWPPGEAAITKDPEYAYRYARQIIKKPWPPGEAAIAGRAKWAYYYALDVMGKWPPGEAAIAGDAEWAYYYAQDIIGKRWPPGEAAIAKDPSWAYLYARDIIGKRWPPGEAAIASDPEYAARYAQDVIKKPQEQDVAEGASNNLQTIIKSFVDSPNGQKYKKYDCKTVTRAFVQWAEQNKIPTQVVSLAPPSADFIAKNPQFQSKKGKPGEGDGHIMPIVNGSAIDFTVRQFGVKRPFENPLVTLINSLPAVYGKFGYFTDNPDWFLGGKSQWIGTLKSIPSEIFNQNFGDEILERHMAENFADGRGPGRLGDSQPHGKYLDA
jgi:hypothetical protein